MLCFISIIIITKAELELNQSVLPFGFAAVIGCVVNTAAVDTAVDISSGTVDGSIEESDVDIDTDDEAEIVDDDDDWIEVPVRLASVVGCFGVVVDPTSFDITVDISSETVDGTIKESDVVNDTDDDAEIVDDDDDKFVLRDKIEELDVLPFRFATAVDCFVVVVDPTSVDFTVDISSGAVDGAIKENDVFGRIDFGDIRVEVADEIKDLEGEWVEAVTKGDKSVAAVDAIDEASVVTDIVYTIAEVVAINAKDVDISVELLEFKLLPPSLGVGFWVTFELGVKAWKKKLK